LVFGFSYFWIEQVFVWDVERKQVMSYSNDEQERLKRLRDRQIAARDPQAKERKISYKVSQRRKSTYRQTTVGDLFKSVPYRWVYMLVGVLLGGAAFILIVFILPQAWDKYLGLIVLVILAIFGFIIGSSIDWREDIKRKL
jgi:VIT1/CCC1 family predicted Fe2+/Mn2+ transporter